MSIKSKIKIGIFGGSFDPPHKGHYFLSSFILQKLNLTKVYWIVAKKNPFKKKTFFSLEERVKKCKNLTKQNKNIKVLFLDKKLRSSRTINILNHLKLTKKKSHFYLIIGSDNLISFHKWKEWQKITKISKIVVLSRKGYDQKARKSAIVKYLNKKNIIFVKNKKIDISSTIIRNRLKK
tara:strand:- start:81 stop:617 length:537 start_codon:yes stop_codon:yes gene_type:complete